MNNLFADRIGNVIISNDVARLDFLTIREIDQKTNKASLELAFRLNIPVEGIMQTIEVLDNIKADLLSQKEKLANNHSVPQDKTVDPAAPTEKKPRKKLTKEMFDKLSPEQQAKIRQRAKLKEQQNLQKTLNEQFPS